MEVDEVTEVDGDSLRWYTIMGWTISGITLVTYSLFLPYFYCMGIRYADILFPTFEQKFRRHRTKFLLNFLLLLLLFGLGEVAEDPEVNAHHEKIVVCVPIYAELNEYLEGLGAILINVA